MDWPFRFLDPAIPNFQEMKVLNLNSVNSTTWKSTPKTLIPSLILLDSRAQRLFAYLLKLPAGRGELGSVAREDGDPPSRDGLEEVSP